MDVLIVILCRPLSRISSAALWAAILCILIAFSYRTYQRNFDWYITVLVFNILMRRHSFALIVDLFPPHFFAFIFSLFSLLLTFFVDDRVCCVFACCSTAGATSTRCFARVWRSRGRTRSSSTTWATRSRAPGRTCSCRPARPPRRPRPSCGSPRHSRTGRPTRRTRRSSARSANRWVQILAVRCFSCLRPISETYLLAN